MSKIKRAVCAVCSVAMLFTAAMFSGCSTPEVAMTVAGREYTTGEYLAYLYNAFYQVYYGQGLYYYEAYGTDVWKQEYPYGEEENAEQLKLAEYIKRLAQDTIIRQTALKNKIDEYGVEERQEDLDEVATALSQITESDTLAMGFSKANYEKMLTAVNTYERQLFYGLYDRGGDREIAQADIEEYFNENYLSYKIIEISLVDSSGADLSEEEVTEIKDRLQGYLDMYNETQDFDKVIEQYEKDEEEDEEGTDSDTDTDSSSTESSGSESSAPESSESSDASDTSDTSDDASDTDSSDASDSSDGEDEEETDPNRHDIDANLYGDEDFTNEVKTVEIGEAKIIEYKKGGTNNTAALLLRLDPAEKEGVEDVLEESREDIIYGLKYEEFDDEMAEYIATLSVDINKTAARMCDPKKFVQS